MSDTGPADAFPETRPAPPPLPDPELRIDLLVDAAAELLAGVAHRTPVVTSHTLDERTGARIFLKCENFQRVGAFKFRGAYHAISRLSAEQRSRGVVAYSSGNHAQAVALAGRLLGAPTTIVMPAGAVAAKRAATAGYGARIVDYEPDTESRRQIAQELAESRGLALVPPYDHPDVIAGQGTATVELLEQVGGLDWLLVPCGGGGLLSGSAVAAKSRQPGCRVVGIEPEIADDAVRSFRTGTLHSVHNPETIADGTRTPSLGRWTFPLVLRFADDMRTVSEEAIAAAVRFLFYRTKLVVEPSGAIGVAALLSGAVEVGGRVGVIVSGGNVDGSTMAAILAGGAGADA